MFLITTVKLRRLGRDEAIMTVPVTSYKIVLQDYSNYEHEVTCAFWNCSENWCGVQLEEN
jgi:hypothetical protein